MDKFDGVIVFGPMACGKSHNADALRRHFGLAHVNHEWNGRERLRERPGTLVLTSADLSDLQYDGFRVISFADAMREACLPNNYRHGRKWLPADWMDEMPPQTGITPEAFLRRHPDTGVLQLWPLDADTMMEDREDFFGSGVDKVVCAWGAHGSHLGQDETVLGWLGDAPTFALSVTSYGMPQHPLYLRADSPLIPYRR